MTLSHLAIRRLKDCGRRLFERWERRRAEAFRRDPSRVIRGLQSARRILILCQGNVIRSVFAAELLSAALKSRAPVSIVSAGLETMAGWRPHARVAARCEALDIDVSRHQSTPVGGAIVKSADVIFVMEVSQVVALARRFPAARRKTLLLTSLAPEVPLEIRDPAGADDAAVDACLDHVARAVKPVIDVLITEGNDRG